MLLPAKVLKKSRNTKEIRFFFHGNMLLKAEE